LIRLYFFFFFFKQKTAYEITYGDWSSDVCSSDLVRGLGVFFLNVERMGRLFVNKLKRTYKFY